MDSPDPFLKAHDGRSSTAVNHYNNTAGYWLQAAMMLALGGYQFALNYTISEDTKDQTVCVLMWLYPMLIAVLAVIESAFGKI